MSKFHSAVFRLILLGAPLALAQGTYTQIDYPGGIDTVAVGINSVGDLSGFYYDSSGDSHGFLLSGGVYSTIDYPGAVGTCIFGLNDEGQLVGAAFTNANHSTIGFIYDISTQTFTRVDYPGAAATIPYAINNSGEVAGFYEKNVNKHIAFELVGTTYTAIELGNNSSYLYAINADGTAVGDAKNVKGKTVNFRFVDGKVFLATLPPGSFLLGVNDSEAVVGYNNAEATYGFVLIKGMLTELNYPEAFATIASGINDLGEVAGNFVDTSGNGHGFTWTPPAPAHKESKQ